jgi:hypothetical protein
MTYRQLQTALQSKATRQAEIDNFIADLGLDQLYADCDRYGINVENLNAEEDRHQTFLSNLSIALSAQTD